MDSTQTQTTVARFLKMSPEDFAAEISKLWDVQERLIDTVKQAVADGTISPYDGFKLVGTINASLYGYEDLNPRQGSLPPEIAGALSSRLHELVDGGRERQFASN